MPNLSKTTIQKMRAVIKAVLAEPEFYDQYHFPQPNDCGGTCCAAGWAVWQADPVSYAFLAKQGAGDWTRRAREALGLPYDIPGAKDNVGDQLFLYPSDWPRKFAAQYDRAKTPLGRAKAMANRWEHFIKTDGVE